MQEIELILLFLIYQILSAKTEKPEQSIYR